MDVTTGDIRRLIDRPVGEAPVTSVYLNTDGAELPRAVDYETHLDGLLRQARKGADEIDDHRQRDAVYADADEISRWVRQEFQRGDVRGLGVFASDGQIFETVQSALPVRNLARVADHPYVVPLEALLGRSHNIGLVIVERDRARILRYQLGRVYEYGEHHEDVPRRHQSGGWSQARLQRHNDDLVLHHYKETAELLRRTQESEPFDTLVLSGPDADVSHFRKLLHSYVEKVLNDQRAHLPFRAGPDDVKEYLRDVEQQMVSARRRELLERLSQGDGGGEKVARGLRHVVEAVNAKSVQVLFVVEGAGEPGYRSVSGALGRHEEEAAAYGTPVEPVEDLIDEIIEEAVRSSAHIELFADASRLAGHPVAALLRF